MHDTWGKKIFTVLWVGLLFSSTNTLADEQILDDLIVDGSVCIGVDCVNPEPFGFDTIRLKGEDLQISFTDTSNTASFPTTDWSIFTNDSFDGGDSYFAISDGVGATPDFRVNAGDNSFLILDETVEVSTADALRRLVNVADGVDPQDAATIGQLTPIKDALDEMLSLGTNPGAALFDLETRMTAGEVAIVDLDGRMDTAEGTLLDHEAAIAQNSQDIADINVRLGDFDISSFSFDYSATGDGESGPAEASGVGSTALGSGASARTRDTAVGFMATVTADGSVAVGADSLVESENSVAVGADSHVASDAAGGVALGQNAQVLQGAAGSVAIGQDSVASEANTISVGSTGNERRVTNVDAAINETDAVNLGQLQAAEALLQEDVSRLNGKVGRLEDRLDNVGALTSAFSALVPNARAAGNTQLSLGVGNYSGANALAAGVFHHVSDNVLVNMGVSSAFESNSTASRAGVTFGW